MAYIGNTVQNQGFAPAIDYFNGNGVTVTFTLSRPVASVAQLIVAIDNVIQNPSSSFTVAGNAITFTSAPLAGTNNIWVEYTSLITTYQGISQDPTVIGDIRATGGYLAEGDFGNSFVDGAILDYVTGAGRVTVGELDDIVFYHGGTASRSEMMRMSYAGNSTLVGGLSVGTTNVGGTLNTATRSGNWGALIYDSANNTAMLQCRNNAGAAAGSINLSSAGATTMVLSSVAGVTFPATQVASADANTLDDYEEGTWTPNKGSGVVSTGTFTSSGTYTKIGRMVYVNFQMNATSIYATSGGQITTNLPFTMPGNAMGVTASSNNAFSLAYGFSTEIYAGDGGITNNGAGALFITITYIVS